MHECAAFVNQPTSVWYHRSTAGHPPCPVEVPAEVQSPLCPAGGGAKRLVARLGRPGLHPECDGAGTTVDDRWTEGHVV